MSIYLRNLLNEKMGVISRVFQEDDIYNISKNTNLFINEIYENANKQHKYYFGIYDIIVVLNYIPNSDKKINAETSGNTVNIYMKATYKNYYTLKYTIIHELIHIIQQWTIDDYENWSDIDKIKKCLRKPYLDDDLLKDPDYIYFMYLLYREDLYEISAWAHDAYINAFLYKVKYPNKSNQEILNMTLKSISMYNDFLNNAIEMVRKSEEVYGMILNILVGHFSELNGNNGQRFFDKEIFELPLIKRMRTDIKKLQNKTVESVEYLADEILDIIDLYEPELLKYKKQITESFIKHMKYWYDKALKQYGKAIILGIEDATK